MKHTRMMALGGVLAVLLMAAVFAGAAAGADDYKKVDSLTANFSVNTTELNVAQNAYLIWQNESAAKNLYYIDLKDGNNSMIPVNVTGKSGQDYIYLGGYNISFQGDLTTTLDGTKRGVNWKFDNITLGSGGSLVNNSWHIAKVIDSNLVAESFKNGADFVNITILNASKKNKVLKPDTNYSLGIRSDAELALVNKTALADVSSMDFIQLAKANVDSTFFNASNFTIYAQNTSRAFEYDFNDFIKFDVNSSFKKGDSDYNYTKDVVVYLYSEHDGGVDYLNLTLDEATYDEKYNTEKLRTGNGITDKTVGKIVKDGTYGKYLNYTLTLNKANEQKQAPLNITLNEFASYPTKNVTGFSNVNVSRWNPTNATNNASNDGLSTDYWSFNTNLSINLTVRAGTVNYSNEHPNGDNNPNGVDWDSWVKFNSSSLNVKVLGGTNSSVGWAFQDIVYTNMSNNAKLTNGEYKVNNLTTGMKAPIVNGKNLTVTNNSINNGAVEVNITFVGYRAGDANLNNEVNIVDSTTVGVMVLKYTSAMTDPNAGYWGSTDAQNFLKQNHNALIYMDCNQLGGDGKIDVADIRAINQYLVGLEPWDDGSA